MIKILWLLVGLVVLFSCENNQQEEPSTIGVDMGCNGYVSFEEGWKEAYAYNYEQYRFCTERGAILQAETDSLVSLQDSFALYVQFILLGNIDPIGGVYNREPNARAYQYLVLSSKRGYYQAKLDLAVLKDRFGTKKTGASAIDFETAGEQEKLGDLFINNKDQADTTLIAQLKATYGWSQEIAGKQAILLPIAFARYHLQQQYQDLTFSPLYHLQDKEQRYPFVQDPVYKWAMQLAEIDAAQHLFSQEAVIAMMNRSPEMKGVNNLLSEGKSPNGAEFRTLLTF